MLQRIQTVWLGIAFLSSLFLIITSNDVIILDHIPLILIIGIVSGLLNLWSIFSFKNRKRQLMLNNFSMIINALLIGLLLYWLLNLSGGINFPKKGIEPIFPVLAIISLVIANLYIRKDDRLVKSVDRLR